MHSRDHQPLYNFEKDTLIGFNSYRLGNILYDFQKNELFNPFIKSQRQI